MSITGFYPLWDKILSQTLQAVNEGCHLEASFPYKGTAKVYFYTTTFPSACARQTMNVVLSSL
jgi:hypothetical protein